MESNENIDMRKIKGQLIAETCKIVKTDKGWKVPSQSGKGTYLVYTESLLSTPKCTCPDYETRGCTCKHIWAVEISLKKEVDLQGYTTITQTKKVTYSQNWSAYNMAQCNEQDIFMKLMFDLCQTIDEPDYKFGRPTLPISKMIFASALKVYSTFSLRRFMSDMRNALGRGYVESVCSYSSVSNYMRDPELIPIIQRLIVLSSLPLKSVEHDFAVDSSGFSTSRFARYFSYKHGKDMKYRAWLKAHVSIGVKTNIVRSCTVISSTCGTFLNNI